MTGDDSQPAPATGDDVAMLHRVGRRVRTSRPGRWCFSQALAPAGRPRSRRSWWGGAADRLLSFDIATSNERRSTADQLVELFFDLVTAWETQRFIEAGAKDAGASRRAVGLASVEQVIAFEANPFTHRRFADELADTGVVYEHLALSNGPTELTFFVRLTADGRPAADGQGSLFARSDHEPGHHQVRVSAVSLDDYLVDRPPRRSALWVDVEGALEAVLTGASQVLPHVDVVLAEVEERPYWDPAQWLRADVDEHFASFGLVPIARDQQSRFQYNVLYVRRSRLDDPELRTALTRWRRAVRA